MGELAVATAYGPLIVLRASARLLATPDDTSRVIPARAWTPVSFLLFAHGAGVGVLLT